MKGNELTGFVNNERSINVLDLEYDFWKKV